MLKKRFEDLRDGARIVSSKAFSPVNFRITDRNLNGKSSELYSQGEREGELKWMFWFSHKSLGSAAGAWLVLFVLPHEAKSVRGARENEKRMWRRRKKRKGKKKMKRVSERVESS